MEDRVWELLDAVRCPLCGTPLRVPHSFGTCGHTFCKECVLQSLERPSVAGSACPKCHEPAWRRDLVFNHRLAAVVDSVCCMAAAVCGTLSRGDDNKRDGPQDKVEVIDTSTKRLRSWSQEERPKVVLMEDHPSSLPQHANHQSKKETANNTPQSVITAKLGTNSPCTTPSTTGGSKNNEREFLHEASLEKHEPTDEEVPSSSKKEHHGPRESPFPCSAEEESAIVQDSQPDNWMAGGTVELSTEQDESVDIVQGTAEDERDESKSVQQFMLEKQTGSSSDGGAKELAATGLGNGGEGQKRAAKAIEQNPVCPGKETSSFLGEAALQAELVLLRQALVLCDAMPTSSTNNVAEKDNNRCSTNENTGTQQCNSGTVQRESAPISHAWPPSTVEPVLSSIPDYREAVATTTSAGGASRQPRTISELLMSQKLTQGVPHQIGSHVTNVVGPSAVRRRIALSTAGPRSCLQHLIQDLGEAEEAPEVTSSTTHVVVAADSTGMARARTMKMAQGLALGCWIVSPDWLEACQRARAWVPESPYEIKGDPCALGGPARARRRRLMGRPGLFHGHLFRMAGKSALHVLALTRAVELGGGTVLRQGTPIDGAAARCASTCVISAQNEPAILARLKEVWGVTPATITWILDHLSRQQEFRAPGAEGETELTVDPVLSL